MKQLLERLFEQKKLTPDQMEMAVNFMIKGHFNPAQTAAFLGALRFKEESPEDIYAFANVLRSKAVNFPLEGIEAVDCCGTGGDQQNTFNISTTVSFVVASCGVPIVKHGNRSVSSHCGSADILEAFNIPIEMSVQEAEKFFKQHNYVFLYAPLYHQAFKEVAPIRKSLGVRTIFNLLGPLLNPAQVSRQLVGVFNKKWCLPMAKTLSKMGSQKALIVSSHDGLDELSVSANNSLCLLENGEIKEFELRSTDVGLSQWDLSEIKGGEKEINLKIIKNVLRGEKGAALDIVLFNAGAVLYVAEKVDSILEGVKMARESIESGQTLKYMQKIQEV